MNVRTLFLENWGIKLLSLVLSLTLWLYVTAKGKTEVTLTVPIELKNVPQSMAVVGNVAGSLDVRVQGQEQTIRESTLGKKMFAVLDLGMAQPGENVVPLSPDDIHRPSGVAVTHLSLSEVKVRLEPLSSRSFRLKVVTHGAPAPGYRVSKIIVNPPRITAEGPASIIRAIDTIQTMPIDISGDTGDVTLEPRIDYQGRSVKILEKVISVTIGIERAGR